MAPDRVATGGLVTFVKGSITRPSHKPDSLTRRPVLSEVMIGSDKQSDISAPLNSFDLSVVRGLCATG